MESIKIDLNVDYNVRTDSKKVRESIEKQLKAQGKTQNDVAKQGFDFKLKLDPNYEIDMGDSPSNSKEIERFKNKAQRELNNAAKAMSVAFSEEMANSISDNVSAQLTTKINEIFGGLTDQIVSAIDNMQNAINEKLASITSNSVKTAAKATETINKTLSTSNIESEDKEAPIGKKYVNPSRDISYEEHKMQVAQKEVEIEDIKKDIENLNKKEKELKEEISEVADFNVKLNSKKTLKQNENTIKEFKSGSKSVQDAIDDVSQALAKSIADNIDHVSSTVKHQQEKLAQVLRTLFDIQHQLKPNLNQVEIPDYIKSKNENLQNIDDEKIWNIQGELEDNADKLFAESIESQNTNLNEVITKRKELLVRLTKLNNELSKQFSTPGRKREIEQIHDEDENPAVFMPKEKYIGKDGKEHTHSSQARFRVTPTINSKTFVRRMNAAIAEAQKNINSIEIQLTTPSSISDVISEIQGKFDDDLNKIHLNIDKNNFSQQIKEAIEQAEKDVNVELNPSVTNTQMPSMNMDSDVATINVNNATINIGGGNVSIDGASATTITSNEIVNPGVSQVLTDNSMKDTNSSIEVKPGLDLKAIGQSLSQSMESWMQEDDENEEIESNVSQINEKISPKSESEKPALDLAALKAKPIILSSSDFDEYDEYGGVESDPNVVQDILNMSNQSLHQKNIQRSSPKEIAEHLNVKFNADDVFSLKALKDAESFSDELELIGSKNWGKGNSRYSNLNDLLTIKDIDNPKSKVFKDFKRLAESVDQRQRLIKTLSGKDDPDSKKELIKARREESRYKKLKAFSDREINQETGTKLTPYEANRLNLLNNKQEEESSRRYTIRRYLYEHPEMAQSQDDKNQFVKFLSSKGYYSNVDQRSLNEFIDQISANKYFSDYKPGNAKISDEDFDKLLLTSAKSRGSFLAHVQAKYADENGALGSPSYNGRYKSSINYIQTGSKDGKARSKRDSVLFREHDKLKHLTETRDRILEDYENSDSDFDTYIKSKETERTQQLRLMQSLIPDSFQQKSNINNHLSNGDIWNSEYTSLRKTLFTSLSKEDKKKYIDLESNVKRNIKDVGNVTKQKQDYDQDKDNGSYSLLDKIKGNRDYWKQAYEGFDTLFKSEDPIDQEKLANKYRYKDIKNIGDYESLKSLSTILGRTVKNSEAEITKEFQSLIDQYLKYLNDKLSSTTDEAVKTNLTKKIDAIKNNSGNLSSQYNQIKEMRDIKSDNNVPLFDTNIIDNDVQDMYHYQKYKANDINSQLANFEDDMSQLKTIYDTIQESTKATANYEADHKANLEKQAELEKDIENLSETIKTKSGNTDKNRELLLKKKNELTRNKNADKELTEKLIKLPREKNKFERMIDRIQANGGWGNADWFAEQFEDEDKQVSNRTISKDNFDVKQITDGAGSFTDKVHKVDEVLKTYETELKEVDAAFEEISKELENFVQQQVSDSNNSSRRLYNAKLKAAKENAKAKRAEAEKETDPIKKKQLEDRANRYQEISNYQTRQLDYLDQHPKVKRIEALTALQTDGRYVTLQNEQVGLLNKRKRLEREKDILRSQRNYLEGQRIEQEPTEEDIENIIASKKRQLNAENKKDRAIIASNKNTILAIQGKNKSKNLENSKNIKQYQQEQKKQQQIVSNLRKKKDKDDSFYSKINGASPIYQEYIDELIKPNEEIIKKNDAEIAEKSATLNSIKNRRMRSWGVAESKEANSVTTIVNGERVTKERPRSKNAYGVKYINEMEEQLSFISQIYDLRDQINSINKKSQKDRTPDDEKTIKELQNQIAEIRDTKLTKEVKSELFMQQKDGTYQFKTSSNLISDLNYELQKFKDEVTTISKYTSRISDLNSINEQKNNELVVRKQMIKEDLKKQFDVLSAEVSAQDPRQIKSNNKNVQELYQLASNYKQVTGGELPYNPNEKHLWDTAFASIDKKIAEYNKETEQREKSIKTAEQEIEKTIAKIGAEEGIIKDRNSEITTLRQENKDIQERINKRKEAYEIEVDGIKSKFYGGKEPDNNEEPKESINNQQMDVSTESVEKNTVSVNENTEATMNNTDAKKESEETSIKVSEAKQEESSAQNKVIEALNNETDAHVNVVESEKKEVEALNVTAETSSKVAEVKQELVTAEKDAESSSAQSAEAIVKNEEKKQEAKKETAEVVKETTEQLKQEVQETANVVNTSGSGDTSGSIKNQFEGINVEIKDTTKFATDLATALKNIDLGVKGSVHIDDEQQISIEKIANAMDHLSVSISGIDQATINTFATLQKSAIDTTTPISAVTDSINDVSVAMDEMEKKAESSEDAISSLGKTFHLKTGGKVEMYKEGVPFQVEGSILTAIKNAIDTDPRFAKIREISKHGDLRINFQSQDDNIKDEDSQASGSTKGTVLIDGKFLNTNGESVKTTYRWDMTNDTIEQVKNLTTEISSNYTKDKNLQASLEKQLVEFSTNFNTLANKFNSDKILSGFDVVKNADGTKNLTAKEDTESWKLLNQLGDNSKQKIITLIENMREASSLIHNTLNDLENGNIDLEKTNTLVNQIKDTVDAASNSFSDARQVVKNESNNSNSILRRFSNQLHQEQGTYYAFNDSDASKNINKNGNLSKDKQYEQLVKLQEEFEKLRDYGNNFTDKQLNSFETIRKKTQDFHREVNQNKSKRSIPNKGISYDGYSVSSDEFNKMTEHPEYAKNVLKGFAEEIHNATILDEKLTNQNHTLSYSYRDLSGQVSTAKISVEDFGQTVRDNVTGSTEYASAFDKVISSLGSKFGEIFRYLSAYQIFYGVVNATKQGIQYVKQLDTAFTEMQKVSSDTTENLESFAKRSHDIAIEIGSTAQQIQSSAADQMRLGYSLQQAETLAKNTGILMNVSEFDNISSATESMVAMVQAFKDADKDVGDLSTEIIDKLNNIGNNFSISTSDLAESLQRSSGTLIAAGNDIDKAIALTTAGNALTQDPESTGSALKVISMRLRGTSAKELEGEGEDTEGLIETTSKLQSQIKKLTAINGKAGVSITDLNGNYRDTYNIIQDIADIWDEIGEADKSDGQNRQAALLEIMAGKTRAQNLASILQNGDMLREVYQASQNSEGSAQHENETYLQSIEAHEQIIADKQVKIWSNTLVRGQINQVIDRLGNILDLVDHIGLIPSAIGTGSLAISAYQTAKGNGMFKTLENGIGSGDFSAQLNPDSTLGSIGELITNFKKDRAVQKAKKAYNKNIYDTATGIFNRKSESGDSKELESFLKVLQETNPEMVDLVKSLEDGKTSFGNFNKEVNNSEKETKGFFGSLAGANIATTLKNLGTNLAISAAVALAIKGLQSLGDAIDRNIINKAKYSQEAMRNSASAYEDSTKNVEDLQKQLEESNSQIDELQSKGPLTFVEQSELEKLKEVNRQLKESLGIAEEKNKINQKQAAIDAAKAYTDTYGTTKNWEDIQSNVEVLKNGQGKHGNTVLGKNLDGTDYVPYASKEYKAAIKDGVAKELFNYLDAQENYKRAKEAQSNGDQHYTNTNGLSVYINKDDLKNNKLGTVNNLENQVDESRQKMIDTFDSMTEYLDNMEDYYNDFLKDANPNDLGVQDKYLKSQYEGIKNVREHYYKTLRPSEQNQEQYNSIQEKIGVNQETQDNFIQLVKNGEITKDKLKDIPDIIEAINESDFSGFESNLDGFWHQLEAASKGTSESVNQIEESIKTAKSSSDSLTNSITAVNSAQNEQNSTGTISTETLKTLRSTIDDVDTALIQTSNGIEINTQKMNELMDSKADKAIDNIKESYSQLSQEYAKQQSVLDDLSDQYEKTAVSQRTLTQEQKISAQKDVVDNIADQIAQLDELVISINNASSAYHQFSNAQQTANQGTQYDSMASAKDNIDTMIKNGQFYTDDLLSYISYALGTDTSELSQMDRESLRKKASEAQEIMKKYFTSDSSKGSIEFLKQAKGNVSNDTDLISEIKDENGNGTGKLKFGNIDKIAETYGRSSDFIIAQLKKLQEYFGNDFINFEMPHDDLQSLKDYQNQLDNLYDTLKQNKDLGINVDDTKLDSEISDVKKKIALQKLELNIAPTVKDENGNESVIDDESLKTWQSQLQTAYTEQVQGESDIPDELAEQIKNQIQSIQDYLNHNPLQVQYSASEGIQAIQDLEKQKKELPQGSYSAGSAIAEKQKEIAEKWNLNIDAVLKIDPNTDSTALLEAYQEKLDTIKKTAEEPKTVQLIVDEASAKKLGDVKDDAEWLVNHENIDQYITQHVTVTGDTPVDGKTKDTSASGGSTGVDSQTGTAFANGTVNVNTNSDQGDKHPGKTLVGELGPELVVRGNEYFTVGNNGAEMVNLKKDDIVFNHKQTEGILKNRKINSRGEALAQGKNQELFVGNVDIANRPIVQLGDGSYANGQNNDLVGELGPELRIRGNEYTLLGQHGAEFADIRSGDIVLNAEQTANALNGKAYVRGKAYANTDPTPISEQRASTTYNTDDAIKSLERDAVNNEKAKTDETKKQLKNEQAKTDAAKEEYFQEDRALDTIKKKNDKIRTAFEDTFKSYEEREQSFQELIVNDQKVIETAMERLNRKQDTYNMRYTEAKQYFSADQLEKIVSDIKNGNLTPNNTTGASWDDYYDIFYGPENTKIENASKLYEKQKEAITNLMNAYDDQVSAEEDIVNAEKQMQQDRAAAYELDMSKIEEAIDEFQDKIDSIQTDIEIKGTTGKIVGAQDYIDLISASQDAQSAMEDKLARAEERLSELSPDSEEYWNVKKTISETTAAIQQADAQQAEWNETIKDLPITHLQTYIDNLNTIQKDLDNMTSEIEAKGQRVTEDLIKKQIDLQSMIAQQYKQQIDLVEDKLNNRGYTPGSDKWNETFQQLQDIDDSLAGIVTQIINFNKQLLQIPVDKLSDVNTEIQNIQSGLTSKQNDNTTVIQGYIAILQKANDDLTESYEDQIKPLQQQLDALNAQNEARQRQLNIEQAQYNLEKAREQKTVQVVRNGRLVYTADQDNVRNAENELAQANYDKMKGELQDKIDALEKDRDEKSEALTDAQNRWQKIQSNSETNINVSNAAELAKMSPEKLQQIALAEAEREKLKNQHLGEEGYDVNKDLTDAQKELLAEADKLYSNTKKDYEQTAEQINSTDKIQSSLDTIVTLLTRINELYIKEAITAEEAKKMTQDVINSGKDGLTGLEHSNLVNEIEKKDSINDAINKAKDAISETTNGIDNLYKQTEANNVIINAYSKDKNALDAEIKKELEKSADAYANLKASEALGYTDKNAYGNGDYVGRGDSKGDTFTNGTDFAYSWFTEARASGLDTEKSKDGVDYYKNGTKVTRGSNGSLYIDTANGWATAISAAQIQKYGLDTARESNDAAANQKTASELLKESAGALNNAAGNIDSSSSRQDKILESHDGNYKNSGNGYTISQNSSGHKTVTINYGNGIVKEYGMAGGVIKRAGGIKEGAIPGFHGVDSNDARTKILQEMSMHNWKPSEIPIIADEGEVVLNKAQQNTMIQNMRSALTPVSLPNLDKNVPSASINISMGDLTLPNVTDGKSFATAIQQQFEPAMNQYFSKVFRK